MAEKTVVEVKEVLTDDEIFGYLGGKQKYTPKVFEEMGVPKAKQFSVNIEPMSDEDCATINSLNRIQSLKMTMWFASKEGQRFTKANNKLKEFDGDTKKFTEKDFDDVQLIVKQREKISNDKEKLKIVQKYISDLSKPHPLASKGTITDEAWGIIPNNIKADIYNRVYDISVLSQGDAVNLQ